MNIHEGTSTSVHWDSCDRLFDFKVQHEDLPGVDKHEVVALCLQVAKLEAFFQVSVLLFMLAT